MKTPITYTGTDPKDLFVLGLKNNKNIKLKVKSFSCHGAITVDDVVHDETYPDLNSLLQAEEQGKLQDHTIYTVLVDGIKQDYIYYNGVLTQVGIEKNFSTALEFGASYNTFADLKADKANLKEYHIYTVTDKGTIEQYILYDDEILQIAGAVNGIMDGNSDDATETFDVNEITFIDEDHTNGIIECNLTELVNGNYRYKNHGELTSVISDMPALKSAIQMFWGCPLTYFCGNLDSLEEAYGMFFGSKLDEDSIINIVDGIKDHGADVEKRSIIIGYNSSVTDAFLENISQEFNAKGWEVQWHKNGEVLPLKTF